MSENRFGTEINPEDILEALDFFDSWEDRYKYIIDLGKELPVMDPADKTEQHLVRGCQSQVWLVAKQDHDKLYFMADSDAFIVKGLLGVVLAAYNAKTPAQITAFDINAYFEKLDLLKHLSSTRGNGLQAMVKKIQGIAAS
jgi:cysteine desulfuration protein SufE